VAAPALSGNKENFLCEGDQESNLFPLTWADEGNLHTAWGDGNGFSGNDRASLGGSKLSGFATSNSGTDL
jgi:hypothetical protein